jgi:hypothetical protein
MKPAKERNPIKKAPKTEGNAKDNNNGKRGYNNSDVDDDNNNNNNADNDSLFSLNARSNNVEQHSD